MVRGELLAPVPCTWASARSHVSAPAGACGEGEGGGRGGGPSSFAHLKAGPELEEGDGGRHARERILAMERIELGLSDASETDDGVTENLFSAISSVVSDSSGGGAHMLAGVFEESVITPSLVRDRSTTRNPVQGKEK